MLLDGRQVECGATLSADVCVVGAGAAGIALARELINSKLDVVLLESGDVWADDNTTALGEGDIVGLPYFPLTETHFRQLGGATAHWDGWIRPLDTVDFEERAWVPLSGWPIERSDLDSYYRTAQGLIDVDRFEYRPQALGDQIPSIYGVHTADDRLSLAVWRKANPPTRFAAKFLPELTDAINVRLITMANVTDFATNDSRSHIDSIGVATLTGNSFRVAATTMVIAAGGLETPRILLTAGLGGPIVGRCWMEHPHVPVGQIAFGERSGRAKNAAIDRGPFGALARLEIERPKGGNKYAYTLSRAAQETLETTNVSLHLRGVSPQPPIIAARLAAGLREPIHTLRRMPKEGEYSKGSQFRGLVKETPQILRVMNERLIAKPKAFEIFAQAEQAPDMASTIGLSETKDALGLPRASLNWRLNDLDKHSIRATLGVLDTAMQSARIGNVEPYPEFNDDGPTWPDTLTGGHHHLGATRMGSDPNVSVVDGDCRVHTVTNLYVAGPSTFPTGGFSNPLLTTVAMALRLAEHLLSSAVF